MSVELFNYLSVAVSIILAISATHLLSGLRDVIAPERRDWLVVCWCAYPGVPAFIDMVVFLCRAQRGALEFGYLYNCDGCARFSVLGCVHTAFRGSSSC